MTPLVVDASAAIAVLREEPPGRRIADVIRSWTDQELRVVVPPSFWLEVVNSLMRRHHWNGDDVLQAIHQLDLLGIQTVDFDRGSVWLTLDATERYGLTAYDGAYVGLMGAVRGVLLTLDRELAAAVGDRAVPLDPHLLKEILAVYEHDVTWPDYSGASAYLAQLRADARAGAA